MSFKEIRVGKELALRFYPSDNGWMCGITPEMMEALEQAEKQEPVAWMTHTDDLMPLFHKTRKQALNWQTQPTPLYTTPPAAQRQPLTEEEIKTVRHLIDWTAGWSYIDFARAIERKHGIGGEHD